MDVRTEMKVIRYNFFMSGICLNYMYFFIFPVVSHHFENVNLHFLQQ